MDFKWVLIWNIIYPWSKFTFNNDFQNYQQTVCLDFIQIRIILQVTMRSCQSYKLIFPE